VLHIRASVDAPFPAVEPPPTEIAFPDAATANDDGVVAVGEDFRAGTILAAYRQGIFPWPHRIKRRDVVLWCSPDPRAHFSLEGEPHWSRSLRRTLRSDRFLVSTDRAFAEVMRLCGETRPEGTWILPQLRVGYEALHALGHAHSVEVWDAEHPEVLVGGIYGVSIGRAFAGESMFHLKPDASKVAFATLAASLRQMGYLMFDVQVMNAHLASLGCVEQTRSTFLERLQNAAKLSQARWSMTSAAPTADVASR
jgi:leucyl/phenylalanyl-tRNA---protein transferase